jgi:hypothetical protein
LIKQTAAGVFMKRKQTFLFFIIFFIMLAAMTIPLWLDTAIPYMYSFMQWVSDKADETIVIFKWLVGQVSKR